mgnify:CR=1 FL=1
MLYSIVGLLVIILDQAVKYWVQNTLFGTDIVKFIPGVISLVNVHNDGAAFSFLSGSGARIYFIIATGVFTVLVIIALATNFISGKLSRWSLVLVTAGGLGNCIDRVIYGYVQDMFKVELFNFAIFNVADVFITVFAIVFVLAMIFEKPEDDDLEDEEFEDEEDEEDASPRPSLRDKLSGMKKEKNSAPRAAKKNRQAEYEEEYEHYKAQRESRPKPAQTPAPRAAQVDQSDPFAEWEKANARAETQRSSSYAARAMGTDAPKYTPPVRQSAPQRRPAAEAQEYTRSAAQSAQSYTRPAAQPAQTAQPVQQPVRQSAPAPQKPAQPAAPAKSSTEFDLDDILNEFK